MTEEDIAKIKEILLEEIVSKLTISLGQEDDNYGGPGGHLSVYLRYDGQIIGQDSVSY
jgi:hypothetical protein